MNEVTAADVADYNAMLQAEELDEEGQYERAEKWRHEE